MHPFIEGFFLQASLILALGAQNIYVLDSGLRKSRHLLVATLCTICDAILISIGVLGAGTVFVQYPWLKISFGALGVCFLAYYGCLKLLKNPAPPAQESDSSDFLVPIGVVIRHTLAFSLLNPHVYLDTVILIGGYSSKFSALLDRAAFGAGASGFSVIWFYGLAIAAAALSRYLHNPQVMRKVDLAAGMILLLLAGKLGLEVWRWC